MPLQTKGLRTESVDHLIVDAGAVYVNLDETDERLLGATRGGSTFRIEQDVREIEVDGSPGPLKGARRVVEVRPQLTTNLLEMTMENLLMAIPGAEATPIPDATATTGHSIRRRRNIRGIDYIKNIGIVGTKQGSGEPVILKIYNAMQDDNFELGTEDKDESVLELTFTGHFDPGDMSVEPWEIIYPLNEGLQSGDIAGTTGTTTATA